jgi:hypothetical protein
MIGGRLGRAALLAVLAAVLLHGASAQSECCSLHLMLLHCDPT